jgi:hypothetical protein
MLSGMAGVAVGWNGNKRMSNEESLMVSYGNGSFRAVKKSGEPLVDGVLHIYRENKERGINDEVDVSRAALVLSPIVLNSNGEAEFHLDSTGQYKFTLTDASGKLLWEDRNITEMASDYWAALGSSSLDEGANLVAHSSVTIEALSELREIFANHQKTAHLWLWAMSAALTVGEGCFTGIQSKKKIMDTI